ncbi:MAG: hypothetical protein Q8O47_01315, partial [Candidatus Bathyarchaeota archaeon]|nr:hypothetical protein [Candidatus Bathyarchaeota archaeon]
MHKNVHTSHSYAPSGPDEHPPPSVAEAPQKKTENRKSSKIDGNAATTNTPPLPPTLYARLEKQKKNRYEQ